MRQPIPGTVTVEARSLRVVSRTIYRQVRRNMHAVMRDHTMGRPMALYERKAETTYLVTTTPQAYPLATVEVLDNGLFSGWSHTRGRMTDRDFVKLLTRLLGAPVTPGDGAPEDVTPKPGLHPANTADMDDRTRRMMGNAASWPCPTLPLKQRGEPMAFGHLVEAVADDQPVTITLSNGGITAYDTIDAALRDGWTVD